MKSLWVLLLIAPAVMAAHDWAHYQMIVERAPFGKEPPPEAELPLQPPGALASEYRLCMLYEDSDGRLKAGLVSKVNDKSLFLEAGETGGDLELVEVRLSEGVAMLQKGSQIALLRLEGLGLPPPGSLMQAAGAPEAAPDRIAARPQTFRRAGAGAGVPAHISTALTDAAPKQARLTVVNRARNSTGSVAEEKPSGSVRTESAGTVRGERPLPPASGGYAVQSVPLYLEKKYEALVR